MIASPLERYLADVVAEPRKHLKAGEIVLLRKLGVAGCAMKARSGWMLAGTWYKDSAFRRFRQLDLVEATYRHGNHKLQPNYRGRGVIALLEEQRQRKAG